ncbi:MAG TPA: hypothetical protein VGV85_09580 [Longimicrobiaceae bacterium]|nr:hypothetical protein [Longimicrobiaceae bacterium]
MSGLKRTTQTGGGARTGMTPEGDQGPDNEGAEFGTSDAGTRGTNRDADDTGTSKNQGHGHPREERGAGGD